MDGYVTALLRRPINEHREMIGHGVCASVCVCVRVRVGVKRQTNRHVIAVDRIS